ncbi:Serine/threonine protein kinase [Sulfidibacter corallicola]|uniref:non-specific serine/threonine protein kinase n=1 Tax=Sulfidibacter corallicola TaxID=2818388 RepID=A0A8A4U0N3_SULCO|nr:serine/threonine-protein kinase [Sulfidibacter corallicola]QTD52305.1 serine/threonine protein kinase [Sulfidibacter corallicola]
MLLIVEKNPKFIALLKEHLKLDGLRPVFVDSCDDAIYLLQTAEVEFLLANLSVEKELNPLLALEKAAQAADIPRLFLESNKTRSLAFHFKVASDTAPMLKLPATISQLTKRMLRIKHGDDPLIGCKIGPKGQEVELIRCLGAGAMGTVYEGMQASLQRRVAVKFLSRDYQKSDPDAAQRFQNEARAVAQLRSNHIVQIYFTGEYQEHAYSVMEFLDGPSLEQYLRKKSPLRVGEGLRLALQVLQGLSEAHRHRQIHRDVKPANVMLNAKGEAVLLDFGLVRGVRAQELTQAGALLGTPRYMAPEQINGQRGDHRADIYSLGIMLYEMLLGEPPFKGKDLVSVLVKHVNQPLPRPDELGRKLDGTLFSLVERLCAKDPGERFQSADAATDAIRGYLATYQEHLNLISFSDPREVRKQLNPYSASAIGGEGQLTTRIGDVPPDRQHSLAVFQDLIRHLGEGEPSLGEFESATLTLPGSDWTLFPYRDGLAGLTSEAEGADEKLRQYHPEVLRSLLDSHQRS